MDRDHIFFNCTQDDVYNEVEYRIGKYEDSDKVRDFIKAKCEDGTIKYLTHAEVKKLLADAGFELL